MKPERGATTVNIPITFDTKAGYRVKQTGKGFWIMVLFMIWLFTSIIAMVIGEGVWRWLYPIISIVVIVYTIRFIVIRERYYRRKREDLIRNNYLFPYSLFWNNYDIDQRYPYIVHFAQGIKGVFVALDKDVIIGKGEHSDYDHHESIAMAYSQMERRGIECIHIDYMDTVGKDDRIGCIFEHADNTRDNNLRKVMMKKADHVVRVMNKSYATYDVYCFYFVGREDLFWDEMQVVLSYFKQANYKSFYVMGREEISELVESLMNIENFSINRAIDELFKEVHKSENLRIIWTEKEGERTQINRTMEEMKESRRLQQSEKRVKKKRSIRNIFRRKKEEKDITLFDD